MSEAVAAILTLGGTLVKIGIDAWQDSKSSASEITAKMEAALAVANTTILGIREKLEANDKLANMALDDAEKAKR